MGHRYPRRGGPVAARAYGASHACQRMRPYACPALSYSMPSSLIPRRLHAQRGDQRRLQVHMAEEAEQRAGRKAAKATRLAAAPTSRRLRPSPWRIS